MQHFNFLIKVFFLHIYIFLHLDLPYHAEQFLQFLWAYCRMIVLFTFHLLLTETNFDSSIRACLLPYSHVSPPLPVFSVSSGFSILLSLKCAPALQNLGPFSKNYSRGACLRTPLQCITWACFLFSSSIDL